MRRYQEIGPPQVEMADPAKELKKDINWVTKKTLSVDNIPSGKLIGFLKKHAVIIAGETTDGREDVAIVLPQISTNDPIRADEVRVASVALQKEATHKAAVQGLISTEAAEEKLDNIDDGIEPRPEIKFQPTSGLKAAQSKIARLGKENTGERRTRGARIEESSRVWQIPQEQERAEKRKKRRNIIMAATIPFVAGACGRVEVSPTQNVTATPEASFEPAETVIPTETEESTPQVSEVPTQTSTPETPDITCKLENGQIMYWHEGEWQEAALPEGTREIGTVEQHEGNWYGIDTYDRAVVVLNDVGEWEEYRRPIVISTHPQLSTETITGIVEEEIPPEEERRFIDGEENLIPYGYLYSRESNENPYAYFSGIVRGSFIHTAPDGRMTPILVTEIPLRYDRLIVTFINRDLGFVRPGYIVPESGNIDEAQVTGHTFDEINTAFSSPGANRAQIIWQSHLEPDIDNPEYLEALNELIAALQEGRAVNTGRELQVNAYWINEIYQ